MDFNILWKVLKTFIDTHGKAKTIFVFLFGIFVSLITVIEPLFFSEIIKDIENYYKTGEIDVQEIINTMIIWGVFIVFNIVLLYIYRYYIIDKLTLVNFKIFVKKYSQKVFGMHYAEYLGKKSGKVYKSFDRGTDVHFMIVFNFLNQLLRQVSSILIIIIILFCIDVKMAFISLSMLPIMISLGVYFNRVTGPKQRKLHERWDKIYGIIGDSMNNFLLFKTLTIESVFQKRIVSQLEDVYNDQLKVSKQWSISDIYTAVLIMISRLLVLGFGIYFLLNGSISFYVLFIVFSYLGWIYFPLGSLFSMLPNLQKDLVAAKKFYEEFEYLEQDFGGINKKKVTKIDGNISFKDVEFEYVKSKKVLNKLSFDIQSGEKIAFVGNTGAGKSTIINLILRFWDPKNGTILVDDKDIIQLDKQSLRKHIGVVTQDNSLFNLSIKQNLLFAKNNATKKQLLQALKDAQADFVFDLEHGIDTIIGERGLKLSGGEKQRLSIARLFLKNPEILILDEATSALDNKTEKLIQKALNTLMKGRTSIIIAHRLSTIQDADKIFMLEKGTIVESGSYNELYKKEGKFYQLANPQHLILN